MAESILYLHRPPVRNNGSNTEQEKARVAGANPPIRIDVGRMNSALASTGFEVPHGLSAEEIRQYIIASAKSAK